MRRGPGGGLTLFQCQACGWTAPRQFEYCQDCGAGPRAMLPPSPVQSVIKPPAEDGDVRWLSEVSGQVTHRPTGLAVVDRALGGGLVPGQKILLAGAPGTGKTMLALAIADSIGALEGERGLYVAGEETREQLLARGRALRRQWHGIRVVHETDPRRIVDELAPDEARAYLIVDSLNVLHDPSLEAMPGSPAHIRACAEILFGWTVRSRVPLILLGHVTWAERLQGPRVVEHLVDTVAYYEQISDDEQDRRELVIYKNRLGPAGRTLILWQELLGP